MSLTLGSAPSAYNKAHQDQVQGALVREDKNNVKTGTVFDKILMKDTATGTIVTLVVTSGALVIT